MENTSPIGKTYQEANPYHGWLDVKAHPPELGQWAFVLCDKYADYDGAGEARCNLFKLDRFSAYTAKMSLYDEEGYETWYVTADGIERKYDRMLLNVTHYKPIPSIPRTDAPVPTWVKYHDDRNDNPA